MLWDGPRNSFIIFFTGLTIFSLYWRYLCLNLTKSCVQNESKYYRSCALRQEAQGASISTSAMHFKKPIVHQGRLGVLSSNYIQSLDMTRRAHNKTSSMDKNTLHHTYPCAISVSPWCTRSMSPRSRNNLCCLIFTRTPGVLGENFVCEPPQPWPPPYLSLDHWNVHHIIIIIIRTCRFRPCGMLSWLKRRSQHNYCKK